MLLFQIVKSLLWTCLLLKLLDLHFVMVQFIVFGVPVLQN